MTGRGVLTAYAVVGVTNVAAEAAGLTPMITVTKPLLMPLLMAWLIVTVRPVGRLDVVLRWLAAGIVAAWIGDLLLMGEGDLSFVAGLVAFLVMQVCYLMALVRVPGPGLVRAWKIAAVPYVLVWLVLNLLVWSGVGALRIPVLVYSAVLTAMAIAALDLVLSVPRHLGWRVAWGAVLFLVSDALIAVTAFGPLSSTNLTSALVMATYIVAQAMIVTGLTHSDLALRGSSATR